MARFARRFIKFYYLRLVRQSGSPDYIARGVAIGLFIGMLVPLGGQMIVALALAYMLKAHKIPALGCTWITNHFTVGVIYPFQCYVGSYLTSEPMKWNESFTIFKSFIKSVTKTGDMSFWQSLENAFHELLKLGSEILVPFFIGGALIGTFLAFIGYFIAYGMIMHHRMKVDMRIKKRLAVQAQRDVPVADKDGVKK